jgi:hypothetical protein
LLLDFGSAIERRGFYLVCTRGERNGNWRGRFKTSEAPTERRKLRELIRQMRITMDELP